MSAANKKKKERENGDGTARIIILTQGEKNVCTSRPVKGKKFVKKKEGAQKRTHRVS